LETLRKKHPATFGMAAWARLCLTVLCLTVLALSPAQAGPTYDGLVVQLEVEADAAVEGRDLKAMTKWATRYEHGEGVSQDADLAVLLYCIAASAEHSDAAYGLGWMYANGRGVARNDSLSSFWMRRAAAEGDTHARRLLKRLGTSSQSALRPNDGECVLSTGVILHLPLTPEPNPDRLKIIEWVAQLAPPAGIDPTLALAIIEIESGFKRRARSHKGATGLMQLIPATAARFGVKDIWDPLANIRGGLEYLAWLRKHFDGDVRNMLAGYNAGEQAVRKYGGIPPYRETQAYVTNVLALCQRAHAGKLRFDLDPAARKLATHTSRPPKALKRPQALTSCL
jgi:hypothetical protein